MSFKVQIKNINQNFDNIILVGGLTIEQLKIKYNWLLNANVKNCILGEDSNGLVWYSGEWICGEWENGTWYSGIWHDGTWKNGRWYSYLIDKAMIISNRFVILDKSKIYSEFRSGQWLQGDFYNGIFGYDDNVKLNAEYDDLTGKTFQSAYWYNGKFHDGLFKKSVWFNGIWYFGEMDTSYWMNGKFYSGTFSFHNPQGTTNWYDGNWYGGDFVEGNWGGGSFEEININVKSRFGIANSLDSKTEWRGGTFYGGEFHSGLNVDTDGNYLPCSNNNITQWLNGDFKNGTWYGGHFRLGNFYYGTWMSGIFNTITGITSKNNCIWHDGKWMSGLWINGVFNGGHFYSGMWLDGDFINGYISTNTIENPLEKQILATNITPPSLTAYTVDTITHNSVTFHGRVTNNGGSTIIDRGVCWVINNNSSNVPVTGDTQLNHYMSDQGTMGNIDVTINGLNSNSLYYMRAYAKNITGLTYSNTISFNTSDIGNLVPYVTTFDTLSGSTSNGVLLKGHVSGDLIVITDVGFGYGTDPDPLNWTDSVSLGATISIEFQTNIIGLTSLQKYYYRAYAKNNVGTGYGVILQFTTKDNVPTVVPTVETAGYDITQLFENSAVILGEMTSNGNDFIINVGACWSTSPNPSILDDHTTELPSSGPIITTINNLIGGTKYYVKAYATNSVGVGYGDDIEIITMPVTTAPTVQMVDAKAI